MPGASHRGRARARDPAPGGRRPRAGQRRGPLTCRLHRDLARRGLGSHTLGRSLLRGEQILEILAERLEPRRGWLTVEAELLPRRNVDLSSNSLSGLVPARTAAALQARFTSFLPGPLVGGPLQVGSDAPAARDFASSLD